MNNRKEAEIGILRNAHHQPNLEIKKLVHGREVSFPHAIKLDDNIRIEVMNAFKQGLSRYEGDSFDRAQERGDPEDFRWVADLEGHEFHNRKLNVNAGAFHSRIFVADGNFYSKVKYQVDLARVTWQGSAPNFFLAKLATITAADIILDRDAGEGHLDILKRRRTKTEAAASYHV